MKFGKVINELRVDILANKYKSNPAPLYQPLMVKGVEHPTEKDAKGNNRALTYQETKDFLKTYNIELENDVQLKKLVSTVAKPEVKKVEEKTPEQLKAERDAKFKVERDTKFKKRYGDTSSAAGDAFV